MLMLFVHVVLVLLVYHNIHCMIVGKSYLSKTDQLMLMAKNDNKYSSAFVFTPKEKWEK